MALLSLSLQAVYDTAGLRTTGALLYVYAAGTTMPAPAYVDPAYVNPHPFPIGLRGNGTWPVIYLPAGSYSLRVTDLGGDVLDEIGLYRVEPESTDEPDPAVDDRRLAQTGDIKDRYGRGSHPGWVPCNGRTIGSEASSATERADDDCEALFAFLWSQDPSLVVAGGRGANAAADWEDGKTIALPDARGRTRIALDDLRATAAGRLTGGLFTVGNPTTLGSYGGEASHVQTVAEMALHDHAASGSMLAAGGHSHDGTTATAGAHFHDVVYRQEVGYNTPGDFVGVTSVGATGANPNFTGFTGTAPAHAHTFTTSTVAPHTHALTVSVGTRGASAAMNWLPPFILISSYIKL